MKELPKLEKLGETPSRHVECLSRWIVEWKIETILGEDEGDHAAGRVTGERSDLDAVVEAMHSDIAIRQIRLLAPGLDASYARPLYMAVVDHAGAGRYLCVPFGRFSEPAFPGELKTGREALTLRVLCIWNACFLPESLLERAWSVGELDTDELAGVSDVRAYLEHGQHLPPEIECRVGPPMIHPLDPRRDYRDDELAWMAALLSGPQSALWVRDSTGSDAWVDESDREPLLAAEGRARYGRVHRYNIVGYALTLLITENAESQSVRIDIVDAGGDASRRLDGGYFISIAAGRSVPVWMGRTWCDRSLLGRGFILFDDRGRPMPTAPVE